jgi:hypothetical protein
MKKIIFLIMALILVSNKIAFAAQIYNGDNNNTSLVVKDIVVPEEMVDKEKILASCFFKKNTGEIVNHSDNGLKKGFFWKNFDLIEDLSLNFISLNENNYDLLLRKNSEIDYFSFINLENGTLEVVSKSKNSILLQFNSEYTVAFYNFYKDKNNNLKITTSQTVFNRLDDAMARTVKLWGDCDYINFDKI